MTRVELQNLHKTYHGSAFPAVNQLSLEIPSQKIVALLGPSGSGKTTVLKMITGLLEPSSGDICFDGNSVLRVPAEKRNAVMVFQNHMLFPYMNVEQNIGFGLKMRGIDAASIRSSVQTMLELVQLPDISKRFPRQLSGGQQQRVALARALIVKPRVLLLDEPLSSLDAHLRDEMRELILSKQRMFGITTVVVTHDQQEATVLADKIALMMEGELKQYGTPEDFYNQPASEQVARFFGGSNFIFGHLDGDAIHTPMGRLRISTLIDTHNVLLTIRPEQVRFCKGETHNMAAGSIKARIYMGTYIRYQVRLESVTIEVNSIEDDYHEGEQVNLYFPPEHLWPIPHNV